MRVIFLQLAHTGTNWLLIPQETIGVLRADFLDSVITSSSPGSMPLVAVAYFCAIANIFAALYFADVDILSAILPPQVYEPP
jgi:hypothetical protein